MCSAFTPDCGYDNSPVNLIGYVCCPKTKCSGKLYLHKQTFQSLGTSDCQSPQCASVCRVRNFSFEGQATSFLLNFGQRIHIFEETENSIQDVIGDVFRPTRPNEKCVYLSSYKISCFYASKKSRACLYCITCCIFHLRTETDNYVVWWWWYELFCKKDNEKRNPSPFSKKFLHQ